MTDRHGIMHGMSISEGPVEKMLQLVHGAAESADQNGLLSILHEAVQHPDSLATRHLEVEALRVEASLFFGATKGAISELHTKKPTLVSENPYEELVSYEELVKSYLDAHRKTSDSIIDEETDDKQARTVNVITRLTNRIQEWDKTVRDKKLIQATLVKAGTRRVLPEDIRSAIDSTSTSITESVWEVVISGREAGAHINERDQHDNVRERYTTQTDQCFIEASDIATNALQELAK